jgi:hypothetical protein
MPNIGVKVSIRDEVIAFVNPEPAPKPHNRCGPSNALFEIYIRH